MTTHKDLLLVITTKMNKLLIDPRRNNSSSQKIERIIFALNINLCTRTSSIFLEGKCGECLWFIISIIIILNPSIIRVKLNFRAVGLKSLALFPTLSVFLNIRLFNVSSAYFMLQIIFNSFLTPQIYHVLFSVNSGLNTSICW